MNLPEQIAGFQLPEWLSSVVALSRPIALTITVATPAVGSFVVGVVAFFARDRAMAMAEASTKFMQGIPDAGWGFMGAVALGYFGAKSFEVTKAPAPPRGRASPEAGGDIPPSQPES